MNALDTEMVPATAAIADKEVEPFIIRCSCHPLTFLKVYWLFTITLVCTAAALIVGSVLTLDIGSDASYYEMPANLFLRHVRGFVVLFMTVAAASKVRLFYERKFDKLKLIILCKYLVTGVISLLLTLGIGYMLIPSKDADQAGSFYVANEIRNYSPKENFRDFFNHLAVHDIPLNMLTTRIDFPNDFGKAQFEEGLGDGYNAPGFVVYGLLFAFAMCFMNAEGEIIRNFVVALHHCLLDVYWILVVYSPVAFFFAGIVVLDAIKSGGGICYLWKQYLFLLLTVVLSALLHIFVVMPFVHLIRTGRNPCSPVLNISKYLFTAFIGGSSVLNVEKTKFYMKRNGFNTDICDRYLSFATVANFDGTTAGFAACAIFVLKCFGREFDWSVFMKLVITGFLVGFSITEYIQGYLFGIIYFLNTSFLPPNAIVTLLLVDWMYDRFRIVANVVGDALTIDELTAHAEKELAQQVPV